MLAFESAVFIVGLIFLAVFLIALVLCLFRFKLRLTIVMAVVSLLVVAGILTWLSPPEAQQQFTRFHVQGSLVGKTSDTALNGTTSVTAWYLVNESFSSVPNSIVRSPQISWQPSSTPAIQGQTRIASGQISSCGTALSRSTDAGAPNLDGISLSKSQVAQLQHGFELISIVIACREN
ncbi:MAG TPA: hypothetical protein VHO01_05365 [Jatrophihabitans sp.]|nr:hypothetical protein [Jatrophihabitans sp.]